MALNKTEKGRAALLERPADMSLLERRALILIDGKRGREQLLGLLGADILPGLERLLREAYLVDDAARPATSKPVLSIVAPVSNPIPPAPAPAVEVPAAVVPRPASQSRRSLAASKMYMLDMLQLQRDAESVSLKAAIQTSPGEDELVYRLVQAVRHIQSVASASYALRVSERLAEILPEAHLPRLSPEPTHMASQSLGSVA